MSDLVFKKSELSGHIDAWCGGWSLYTICKEESRILTGSGVLPWTVYSGDNPMQLKRFRTLSEAKQAVRIHFADWIKATYRRLNTVAAIYREHDDQ